MWVNVCRDRLVLLLGGSDRRALPVVTKGPPSAKKSSGGVAFDRARLRCTGLRCAGAGLTVTVVRDAASFLAGRNRLRAVSLAAVVRLGVARRSACRGASVTRGWRQCLVTTAAGSARLCRAGHLPPVTAWMT